MISRLKGMIIERSSQSVVLEVQGVGYQVYVPEDRLYKMLDTAEIIIYYHWTAEQGPTLYGFASEYSRAVFSHIISCSGCGPKIGLAVLSSMTASQFVQAILLADVKALSSVNGIGQKKAELLITQLKDKIAKSLPHALVEDHASLIKIKQLSGALLALHYTNAEIATILDELKNHEEIQQKSFDELLRFSLQKLAKRL